MSNDDKVLDDKARNDRMIRAFANDDYLIDFVKSVLVRDKDVRYKTYGGYLEARRTPSLILKLANAMVLAGADEDDIEKALDDIGISGEWQSVKKEKPTLHLAQITPNMTKNEIQAVAEKMAEAILTKPANRGV